MLGADLQRISPVTLNVDSGLAIGGTPTRLIGVGTEFGAGDLSIPFGDLRQQSVESFWNVGSLVGVSPGTTAHYDSSVTAGVIQTSMVALQLLPGVQGCELTDLMGGAAGVDFLTACTTYRGDLVVCGDGSWIRYLSGDQPRLTAMLGDSNVAPLLTEFIRSRTADFRSVRYVALRSESNPIGRVIREVRPTFSRPRAQRDDRQYWSNNID